MASFKIRKGDKVVVLSGGDKGKTGEVKKVLPGTAQVIVQGVNVKTKHRKPSQSGPGGLDKVEAPIYVSKVALADPKTGRPTRVGFKDVGGKKLRVARRSGETID